MAQIQPIFWDIETTGLRPDRDRIIEIAGLNALTGATFSRLIDPEMPVPEEAQRIHGISDSMLSGAPRFAAILPEWLEFCGERPLLIAHNGDSFDMRFLRAECTRCGHTLPSWGTIDTLKWARRYRPDLPKHQLQYLREVYGIPANQAHRALDDVRVLADVFTQMVDDLPWDTVAELITHA